MLVTDEEGPYPAETVSRSRMPRPMPSIVGQGFLNLPLDAREGFLLSRIDGVTSEGALAELTGIEPAFVHVSLDKFWSLGLIDFESPDDAPQKAQALEGAEEPQSTQSSSNQENDLTPEQRLWCEATSIELTTCTHYELLRVPRDADKKAVKRAYYELASRCHPDRFFRKNLGSYKLRLEAIFGRITLAHDTLTNRKQREDYDRYLTDTETARALEHALSTSLIEGEIALAEAVVIESSRDGGPVATPARPNPFDSREAPTEPRFVPGAASSQSLLARRLLGKRPGSTPPAANEPSTVGTEQAMDSLKRRYQQRTESARKAQTAKYEKQGEEATQRGDLVAAANAFRIAISLLPDDAELLAKQEAAQKAADTVLCETYERQANYEEKSANFREAARNWCRVARIKTMDANAHERAAHALVRSDGDLHQAKELGMRAVELEPQNVAHRVTLANVYLAAGLPLNAKRELLAAKQFAPQDATVSAMLRRIAEST